MLRQLQLGQVVEQLSHSIMDYICSVTGWMPSRDNLMRNNIRVCAHRATFVIKRALELSEREGTRGIEMLLPAAGQG